MNQELYNEAVTSDVISEKLVNELKESMEYSSISFVNWTIEVLKILRTRLRRGDRITYEATGEVCTEKTLHKFVSENFSSYIESQVFDSPDKAEKVYFSLKRTETGYSLVMENVSDKPTYRWISSLSEKFSLVEMIATGIVYVKDIRSKSYQPFISSNGRYCRYDSETGDLVEV